MEKRPIGDSGLSVTGVCFGTSPLGNMPDTYGYGVDDERARETVRAIFDGPVNFMDVSRNYGFGRSEERIGDVVRERGGLPEGFVLATKLDRDMDTNRFDAAQARRSIEESLEALSLDRVQILHLHDPEYARDLKEVTSKGGALTELFKIREEGLADTVGIAMGRLDIQFPLVRELPFDVLINHNRFTLLNRQAEEFFDFTHAKGIAIFNAAPYAGGILAKGSAAMPRITYMEKDAAELAQVREIERVCAAHGVTPGAAALQFSLRDPRITSTIVGISAPERVAETVAWAGETIPDAAWKELEQLPYETGDPEANRVYRPG